MKSFAQHVRWLVLALCTVATLALNHQWVATWRVAVPAGSGTSVVPGKNVLVVRERVALPTLQAEAPSVDAPVQALLPDPLAGWRAAPPHVALVWRKAGPLVAVVRTLAGAPAVARLLGTALSPQAP